MTQSVENPKHRLAEWLGHVETLIDQISEWSQAEGWTVERSTKTIREKPLGAYTVPQLHVQVGEGEIEVEPMGIDPIGGHGRVVVRAIPTLSRVKLLDTPQWTIMTDSNVPLRLPWTRETYAQLVRDLLT
jgi:hypothetical protein